VHGVRWGGGFERVFVYTVCMRAMCVCVCMFVCVRRMGCVRVEGVHCVQVCLCVNEVTRASRVHAGVSGQLRAPYRAV